MRCLYLLQILFGTSSLARSCVPIHRPRECEACSPSLACKVFISNSLSHLLPWHRFRGASFMQEASITENWVVSHHAPTKVLKSKMQIDKHCTHSPFLSFNKKLFNDFTLSFMFPVYLTSVTDYIKVYEFHPYTSEISTYPCQPSRRLGYHWDLLRSGWRWAIFSILIHYAFPIIPQLIKRMPLIFHHHPPYPQSFGSWLFHCFDFR